MKIENYYYKEGDGLIIDLESVIHNESGIRIVVPFETLKEWAKETEVLDQTFDWVDIRGEHQQSKLFDYKPEEFDDMLEAFVDCEMNNTDCENLYQWIKKNKI